MMTTSTSTSNTLVRAHRVPFRAASRGSSSPALLAAIFASVIATAQADPAAGEQDVFALGRAAVALSRGPAAAVWPGLAGLGPEFAVVDGGVETVVCRDSAPGFQPVAAPPLAGCDAFERPRVFPEGMQASLNLFGVEETVLVSPPAALGQDALEWTLLFVHERFHQLQSTFPDYRPRIDALDLDNGDDTGMWMLMHPFPYDDPSIAGEVRQIGRLLATLMTSNDTQRLADYLVARQRLMERLSPKNRRYLEFQVWKEGAARWTEIAVARSLAGSEHPQAAEFARLGQRIMDRVVSVLDDANLPEQRRGWFYVMGAAEWSVVDRFDPGWRDRYAGGPLAAGPYLEAVLANHHEARSDVPRHREARSDAAISRSAR